MDEYNCAVCLDDKSYKGCYACADEGYEEEEILYLTDHMSFPIEANDCTYFGRMSDQQPDIGVIYSMLDEHIKKIIDKRANQFISVLDAALKKFKKDNKEDTAKTRKSLAFAKVQIKRLEKKNVKIEKDLAELKANKVELSVVHHVIEEKKEEIIPETVIKHPFKSKKNIKVKK